MKRGIKLNNMNKILFFISIVFTLFLAGCSVPVCVETGTRSVVIQASTMVVKEYWTGLPRTIHVPERIEQESYCVKWSQKEININK